MINKVHTNSHECMASYAIPNLSKIDNTDPSRFCLIIKATDSVYTVKEHLQCKLDPST